jgi:hypothetical protein
MDSDSVTWIILSAHYISEEKLKFYAMKRLSVILLLCIGVMSANGQECYSTGYNPDSDESGHINITDLLDFLLVFGNEFEPDTLCVDTNWVDCFNPFLGEWVYISVGPWLEPPATWPADQLYYLTGTGAPPESNTENWQSASATFNGNATGPVDFITVNANGSIGTTTRWYVYDCETSELATADYSSSYDDGERWKFLNEAEYIVWYADQGMYIKIQFVQGSNGTNSVWHTFYRSD